MPIRSKEITTIKKFLTVFLCLTLLLSAAACGGGDAQNGETVITTQAPETTQPPPAPVITEEVKAKLDGILESNGYKGITYLTHNGQVVYQTCTGTNDLGEPLNADSPMLIGSVSKQFCAASILMLRDQGKLSLDDTLDTYFPEFTAGKDITLKHLLTMHSGLNRDPQLSEPIETYIDNTAQENLALIKEWTFSQPLKYTPGTKFEYSNLNYILLALIVETQSGLSYRDFIYQHIFEPLGMTHSALIGEIGSGSPRTQGLTYDRVDMVAQVPAATYGCGDIVASASDLDIWMTALQSGKVISPESYREMTTLVDGYGYGLMSGLRGGKSHGGTLPAYTSYLYFNEEYGYNFFIITNETPALQMNLTTQVATKFLNALFQAVDAAQAE